MYRSGGPPSKASPSTRCQKCLQYGHYSYECKVSVRDRPYNSRPSRTQQLFNPKLQPKLSQEVPNPLLQKAGIADAQLAIAEAERNRHRSVSASSSSTADSVETVSTNAARSPSPPQTRRRANAHGRNVERSTDEGRIRQPEAGLPDKQGYQHRRPREKPRRRKSRLSSSRSQSRESTYSGRNGQGERALATSPGRGVNAALRSPSPAPYDLDFSRHDRSRRRSPYQRSRRTRSRSPARRYDRANEDGGWKSTDRDKMDRQAQGHRAADERAQQPARGRYQHQDGGTVTYGNAPRGRSLSPYSKRLALTRAMNQGA